MSVSASRVAARSIVPPALVAASVALLFVGVVSGVSTRATAALVVITTIGALAGVRCLTWPRLVGALILIILLIPIRRYALPGTLPFQLELYRVFVALLVLGWVASLLVDSRVRFRRTGFEAPLAVIVGAVAVSLIANSGRVGQYSTDVNKKLMFFLSFVVVLYIFTSVIRRLDVDHLVKTLVAGGAVVAIFAIIEARTGYNAFNHLSRIMPFLRDEGDVGGFQRVGTAKLRVFASAQHPVALSAAFVMLTPLALYLARRYRRRRWILCALAMVAGCASTVSRTGVVMFVVVALVFVWLRPREARRMWPALLLAPIVIHFALPGTLGAIKQSFIPKGGLVAEQSAGVGSGSGRLAKLRPGLRLWEEKPLAGQGFGTKLVIFASIKEDPNNVLDDQWLGNLLEVGALGTFGWLWFFGRAVRRFGAAAKRDNSERGWLLAAIAAAVAAYGVGMLTYDAFAFIQVTFLLFIFVGLGSVLIADPISRAARRERSRRRRWMNRLAGSTSPA